MYNILVGSMALLLSALNGWVAEVSSWSVKKLSLCLAAPKLYRNINDLIEWVGKRAKEEVGGAFEAFVRFVCYNVFWQQSSPDFMLSQTQQMP